MSNYSRELDVNTAYVGMTLQHTASKRCYSVEQIIPALWGRDTLLKVKGVDGKTAFVGTDFIDPDDFVSLHPKRAVTIVR